jgi:hypothetical protein
MQMALAKRYARKEPSILFCSVHPGWSETDGVKVLLEKFSVLVFLTREKDFNSWVLFDFQIEFSIRKRRS